MEAARAAWRRGDTGPALRTADFLVTFPQRGGLFPTTYELAGARFGANELFARNALYSARMMGETLTQLVRFSREVRPSDPKRADLYLAFAERAGVGLTQLQRADGAFCKFWSRELECLDWSSTNGAYLVSALLELWKETHDQRYLKSARGGLGFLGRLVAAAAFAGDALDSDCADKESAESVLQAYLDALESGSGEAQERSEWLSRARQAADFALSWMFVQNVAFEPGSDLARLGYQTRGGTSVSVAHAHLDFYGPRIAVDFLRLDQQLDAATYRPFARLMLDYAFQLVARPENKYLGTGEAWRLGWQPEQQYMTDWTMLPHGMMGLRKGRFFHSLAWISATQLEAFDDLEARFAGSAELRAQLAQFAPGALDAADFPAPGGAWSGPAATP
jgi:hypothetical protein